MGGGFGSSFQWHLHRKAKVTAVCDIRPDRLQRLSEDYKCGNTYKNFREMLKHPELDAVAIFTPAPLHVWMEIEALKAGKHVISAVPPGMSVEELAQLLDTVKRTSRRLLARNPWPATSPGFQSRLPRRVLHANRSLRICKQCFGPPCRTKQ